MSQANTKLILSSVLRDEYFNACYLSNSLKQLHMLDVLTIDPSSLSINLKPPYGRNAPLDPGERWVISFRDSKGAYEAAVTAISVEDGALHVTLAENLDFHSRRRGIRFSTDSRVPVAIRFRFQGEALEGVLMDLSLEGVAIQVPKKHVFSLNESICRGSFNLRSREVGFTSADICNISYQEDNIRLGLHFRDMDSAQAEALADVFHAWHHSQSLSFSPAEEG